MTEGEERGRQYTVVVDDNFHYQDEEERSELGGFSDRESALARCRQIVDGFLADQYRERMPVEELWQLYVNFGEDPWVPVSPGEVGFSAWDYARRRCWELCGGEQPES
jgi:hypothetical protein